MKKFSMVLVALGAIAASATTSSAGCVQAGGEATMVTEDLAKFMAEAALKNSINGHGWKPAGAVKMTCDTGSMGLPHCMAKRKACT